MDLIGSLLLLLANLFLLSGRRGAHYEIQMGLPRFCIKYLGMPTGIVDLAGTTLPNNWQAPVSSANDRSYVRFPRIGSLNKSWPSLSYVRAYYC